MNKYQLRDKVDELTNLNSVITTQNSHIDDHFDALSIHMDAIHRIVGKVRDSKQSDEVKAFWGGIVQDLYSSSQTYEKMVSDISHIKRANVQLCEQNDALLDRISELENQIENIWP